MRISLLLFAPVLAGVLIAGCSKAREIPAETGAAHIHHHHAPHGGTVVDLGEEEYHLELVQDDATGKLQAFVLDSELENFVRSSSLSIGITATAGGTTHDLVLAAVANPETGETVGDSALFECDAAWLKATPDFEGVLKSIAIRGASFSGVSFNFPKGNEAAH